MSPVLLDELSHKLKTYLSGKTPEQRRLEELIYRIENNGPGTSKESIELKITDNIGGNKVTYIKDVGVDGADLKSSNILSEAKELVQKNPQYEARLNIAIAKYERNVLDKLVRLIEHGQYNKHTIDHAYELAERHPEYKNKIESTLDNLNIAIAKYERNVLDKLVRLIEHGQYNKHTIDHAYELAERHPEYKNKIESALDNEKEYRNTKLEKQEKKERKSLEKKYRRLFANMTDK
jgi:hypothetical protein